MGSAYPARLANLAEEAAFKLKRADEYRTSASILLVECKRRIEAGDADAQGLTWPEYCRVHCPLYPPSYLHELVRRHLLAEHGFQDDESSDSPNDPFDRPWAGFIMLPPARQKEFLRCAVAYTLQSEGASLDSAFRRQPGTLDWEA